MASKPRRIFSDAFKRDAAHRVRVDHESVQQVADDLKVSHSVIHRWVQLANEPLKKKGQRKPKRTLNGNAEVYVYLRQARRDIIKRLASGELKAPDLAHLLLQVALKRIEAGSEE